MIKTYISGRLSLVAGVAGALAVVGLLAVAGTAYATIPTFSQASITVGTVQSTTITSANNTQLYIGSNSTPTDVSAVANGTSLTVTGLAPGSSNLSICNVGTASDCTNLFVSVEAGSVSGISFSSNNFSLSISGSQSVTVSGGTGVYSISSNSNTSVVSTNLSGNTLTVNGLAAGGATITVCDSAQTCGTLTVTIGSSSTSSSGLTFSQSSLSIAVGTNGTVNVYGGNGTYEISNDSNSSVISPGTSGNELIIYGSEAGSATLTVCDTTGSVCGTLSVTVTSASSNQAVTFNPSSPSVAAGQTVDVALSGGATTYVVLSNSNGNIAEASTAGNTLSIEGMTAGNDSLTICATGGGCNSVTVTVTGSTNTTTPTTTTAPTTVTPTPTTVTGSVVANATLVAEVQALQALLTQTLSQIESMQAQLNQIVAQVNAGSGASASVSASSDSGSFTEILTVGSQDAQVTALQDRLTVLGFYSGPVTGYYGALTQAAVMKYQTAHGIAATGSVGVATEAALNAGD